MASPRLALGAVLAGLVILLAAAPVRAGGLERVKAAGVLRWGGDLQGGEPFASQDPRDPERLVGFEVDVASAIAGALGVRAEFVENDWSTLARGEARARMIRIDALAKSYAGAPILRGVDVTFARGQVAAVVGPSGAGKSTLLRCINGLEAFDAGAIRVGEDTLGPGGDRPNRRALASIRRRVGFVFQTWNLFAHRTALANVMEGPVHVAGVPAREARDRAAALLDRVRLAHRAHAYPHELSGGEQQRVAIARALAMSPDALLLDEPTSALDPANKTGVLAVLRELAASGMTMILVTHDIAFVREVATRAVLLEGGKVADDGPAGEVLERAHGVLDGD